MTPNPTAEPPVPDAQVWFREDRVNEALAVALKEAVETHGNKAKAIVWDVRSSFERALRTIA